MRRRESGQGQETSIFWPPQKGSGGKDPQNPGNCWEFALAPQSREESIDPSWSAAGILYHYGQLVTAQLPASYEAP